MLAIAVALAAAAALLFVFFGKRDTAGGDDTGAATVTAETEEETEPPRFHVMPEELRGVYVPSVYNLTFPEETDLGEEELRTALDSILDDSESLGFNCIIFQVRPQCDALYRSDIYPVSRFLSTENTLTLDCLEYLLEKAHGRNIAVYAWINPLRVSAGKMTVDGVQDGSPAKGDHREYVVEYGGRLYFDPAYPEVRDLVAAGVSEIVSNYEVDGVIFDDYFYPYPESVTNEDGTTSYEVFDDAKSFEKYAAEGVSLEDFRRDNVNKMIEQVYGALKEADAECQFGVAPFGILKNVSDAEGNLLTRGLESYGTIYCDPAAWIDGGYIDFIAPQIYWPIESKYAPFDVLAKWWSDLTKDTNVTLYISHAASYYGESLEGGELTRQVEYTRALPNCSGNIYYSYAAFRDDLEGIRDEIKQLYKQ